MAPDIGALALGFIEQYGLLAMFILLVLDSALLLPVFPGEIVLIMAVATYGTDPSGLLMLIVLATTAALVGSLLLYAVLRGGGRRLVERYPKFFMMPRKRREKMEALFQKKSGQSLVMFLRIIPLTRIIVTIPAGLARMPALRFIILSTIGLAAYHIAFLWFTFEANRPGSTISQQKDQLAQAYASPMYDYVTANTAVTGAGLLLFGAFLSMRASVKMRTAEPDESTGSLLGSLTIAILMAGGLLVAALAYLEPETAYRGAEMGGLDIHQIAGAINYEPVQLLWTTAAVAVSLGMFLEILNRDAAQRRRRFLKKWHAKEAERRAAEAASESPDGPASPSDNQAAAPDAPLAATDVSDPAPRASSASSES